MNMMFWQDVQLRMTISVIISFLVKYTVTVKTGDVKYGSTKAKIFIRIFGTSKKTRKPTNTSPMHLTGAVPEDKFLRSS